MKIKLILAFASIAIFVACNNSSDKKENKEDSPMNMDTMHQMPGPGSNVPALPAVPEGARVFFKNLKDGDEVRSPFKIEMGAEIMKVDTAGPVVAGSGHHHLMIDGPDFHAAGDIVGKDSVNIHFGKGQTEYEITLSPGKHKLTLQMADGLHRSYGEKLAATITVNVKK